jgi:maltooligosyltrehalose trehalohydrolase
LTDAAQISRCLGASRSGEAAWSFLVWAPDCSSISVRLYDRDVERTEPLAALSDGYFGGVVEGVSDPPSYRFLLPDGTAVADPASRWQPEGVAGPSRGVDLAGFAWSDAGFRTPPLPDTVIYELHVGTFTAEGTFDAAIAQLGALVDLGVTAVEPMPINAFPGVRNWGYDGAFPFAVQDSYGGPAGFQRLVDACHGHGLAVILDVVYNHLGPEGTVLARFAPYFTDVYSTPWGAAVNVAEAGSDGVRRYFIDNAVMWIRDYHVDGLRLDAIHGIVDPTASPFLRELTARIADLSGELGRPVHLIAESADNNPEVVRDREAAGLGFDAQWNDDFHHALHAVLTGERGGYYVDYGRLDQLARAINDGFVFQGEYSTFRGRRHGASSRSVPSDHLVVFAQNHDQVGNRAKAERLVTLAGVPKARLAAAVMLLSPFVPLLFMGEEYAETAPFPYFVDHSDPALLDAVRKGRADEFGRGADDFDPVSESTFDLAKLDRAARAADRHGMLATYRELIAARRTHPAITDPEALETMATADATTLTVVRRTRRESAFAAYNFGETDTAVAVPGRSDDWTPVLGAAESDESGALRLPPCGFALFVAPGDPR